MAKRELRIVSKDGYDTEFVIEENGFFGWSVMKYANCIGEVGGIDLGTRIDPYSFRTTEDARKFINRIQTDIRFVEVDATNGYRISALIGEGEAFVLGEEYEDGFITQMEKQDDATYIYVNHELATEVKTTKYALKYIKEEEYQKQLTDIDQKIKLQEEGKEESNE